MAYRRSGLPADVPGVTRSRANKAALKSLVDAGLTPGLIGYRDGAPVGWVSLCPREQYARLRKSPVMKAVDDSPVWSIVCFVVPSRYRGQGVARALLREAERYARAQGALILEAYPVDLPKRSMDSQMWFGAMSMFADAGYTEVARRKPHRPVVRKVL